MIGLFIFFIKIMIALFLLAIGIKIVAAIFSGILSIGKVQGSEDSLENILKEANEKLQNKN
jgi:hypothetical protein